MTETPTKPIDAATRHNLIDVLEFLERRGAPPDTLRLALVHAGVQPDVARLLARCMDPEPPREVVPPDTAPGSQKPECHPKTAAVALRWFGNTFVVWGLALIGGFALGFMVGAELGVAYGIDQGLDHLKEALQSMGEGRP